MKIVVGIDGSEHSRHAIEWCARMAPRLDAEVVVVHAIEMPITASGLGYLPAPPLSEQARADIRRTLTESWCKPLADAGVTFRALVVDGNASVAIIEVAGREDADLVVTGRRGRGGFAELVLGSTSHELAHHLGRPLVVIP